MSNTPTIRSRIPRSPASCFFTVPHKVKTDPKNEGHVIFCKDDDKAKVQSLIPDGKDDMVIRSMGGNRSEPPEEKNDITALAIFTAIAII